MVRNSRYFIKDDILVKLYQLFFEVMNKHHDHKNYMLVMDDLYTPAEKIMFAKRIAVVFLILKGFSR
jgi:uncharacterized protein YerC